MSDPNDNVPVGGGTPPLPPIGGPSFEAEEKALKKGSWRMLAGMILAVLAAGGALAFFMAPDEREAYREFGKKVNGLDEAHFDLFMGCVFQNVDLRNLRSNADFAAQIQRRAQQGTKRYGAYVRERCMPKLAPMQPKLSVLIPPEGFQADVRAYDAAIGAFRSSWSEFIAYLDTIEDYDPDAATPAINKISRAWYDYTRAYIAINRKLREKIGGA